MGILELSMSDTSENDIIEDDILKSNVAEDDILSVRIFHINDDSLKSLGELLRNKTSRELIMLLHEEEMYISEISVKLSVRVSLVIHHLKKLRELGLLSITEKPISKRTKNHKYYKIKADAFTILFTKEDTIGSSIHLKKILKNSIKFASIGIAGVVTWFSMHAINQKPTIKRGTSEVFLIDVDDILFPIIITGMVIGFGLIMLYFQKKKN